MDEKELNAKILEFQELDEKIKILNTNLAQLQSVYAKTENFINNFAVEKETLVSIIPGVLTKATIDNQKFLYEIGENIYEEVTIEKLLELLKKRQQETIKKADELTKQINDLIKEAKELEDYINKNVQLPKE
ncbi:MAG: hypothetical protein QXX36_00470 [Candidatus Rehaiarchaeum fermentans]|nr:hypothetical protein [Candidatus Rehaiarchaeum fermentans]MCW1292257.1 hypothetical protein [Candidatus Rehaiarchaeum fermentans]MCW1292781.1 hypothetical protein [Candidatus Rehaiarchaeum fermentans]MCW1297205.1 hypothetical protein [Candidatus Rehaiarchaeum fermentans]MCW1302100.1 hypothetical protein [Candidatus Rehaiarchaeum fermentans]